MYSDLEILTCDTLICTFQSLFNYTWWKNSMSLKKGLKAYMVSFSSDCELWALFFVSS